HLTEEREKKKASDLSGGLRNWLILLRGSIITHFCFVPRAICFSPQGKDSSKISPVLSGGESDVMKDLPFLS
ncbi:hypothetical protein, partial [Pseudomonas lurida]|uniref:hypothetical protein n=1 Tax=Pseudomonas lurida TaxID=244566 RepID=UPI0034D96BB7